MLIQKIHSVSMYWKTPATSLVQLSGWPLVTYACVWKTFFPFWQQTPHVEKYGNLPRFKDITVDREIVKVCNNQDRVLLVLPIVSNVLKCSGEPM